MKWPVIKVNIVAVIRWVIKLRKFLRHKFYKV